MPTPGTGRRPLSIKRELTGRNRLRAVDPRGPRPRSSAAAASRPAGAASWPTRPTTATAPATAATSGASGCTPASTPSRRCRRRGRSELSRVEAPLATNPLQLVRSPGDEAEPVSGRRMCRLRCEQLAGCRKRDDSRPDVDGEPGALAVGDAAVARMDADPDRQPERSERLRDRVRGLDGRSGPSVEPTSR